MGNYADAASITSDQDQYQLIDNDGGFWSPVSKLFNAYAHVITRHIINEDMRNAFHFQMQIIMKRT